MGILSDLYSFKDFIMNSESKILSTGEISLWYGLKMCQPEDAELFYVSTWMLEKITGLSHKGLYKARQNLVHKGFIEYSSNPAANRPGQYCFLKDIGIKVHTEVHKTAHTKDLVPEKVHTVKPMAEKVHTGIHTEVHTAVHLEKENVFGKAAKQFKIMMNG